MKNKQQYEIKTTRPFGIRFLSAVMRLFKRKPEIVNFNEGELPKKAIYLMNHCGANGPFTFELYFPVKATPWGAHEMCGNYKERWNYLYHVFYRQKLHWGKFKSFVVATAFAVISKYLYNCVGLIGTYADGRLLSTIRNSVAVLDSDMSILIFPEDSKAGYIDKPTSFNNGFVALSDIYYRKTGIDLPVYSVYYSKDKNKFVVDQPIYVNQLLKEGRTRDEISDIFLNNCHYMCDYAAGKKPKTKLFRHTANLIKNAHINCPIKTLTTSKQKDVKA